MIATHFQQYPIAAIVAMFILAGTSCAQAEDISEKDSRTMPNRELIVLAAPRSGDEYYADVAEAIYRFHISYAKQILDRDDVLVLTDEAGYADYEEALGTEHVVIAPMDDIWMRDFSLSNVQAPVMFRYTAAGQGGNARGQFDADAVQENFTRTIDGAGLTYRISDLLNDGGNFVDDYAGRVVVSRKFLADNALDEETAREAIKHETGMKHVAFIDADEQGGLEHADGVVAFVEPNVLVVNRYEEDPDYAAALRADLESGLPGVTLHEIVTPYDGTQIYDDRFGSACGLYTNMLVTPNRIYLPTFGIPEDDVALASMEQWTDKEIVPVSAQQVCAMGGGVRCMSWQLRGKNAEQLLEWARMDQ